MENASVSAPWVTFCHEFQAMFGQDDDIRLRFNDDDTTIEVMVDDFFKEQALMMLLPEHRQFGNIDVTITVIPANKTMPDIDEAFATAFMGNPVFNGVIRNDRVGPMGRTEFVMFHKEVAQFFNDELNDPYGNKSMLYQDIAKDIFGENLGVFFCTDEE